MDFHILSSIQKIKPDLLIKNEVIEPSATQITLYKERMSNAPSLSNISFTYQHKKAEEYQQDVNLKKECKKFDFIHMIQMIYYVKDARSTLESFKSCLAPNGKLLIIILSGKSGWINIIKKYEILLHESEGLSLHLCSEDIINMLDTMSVTYETYDIPTSVDITECFIEGSQNGELILDILTEICHFSKNVPSTIKQQIMEDFKSPEFSDKKDGKIFFNTDLIAIIVKNK
ncbi:histamine N-methyltransferase-like [Rhinophrynus dorsalis]